MSQFIQCDYGSPIFAMQKWYADNPSQAGMAFDEALRAYLAFGYVYSGPDLFIMARMIPRGANVADICDPYHDFTELCDCWHVEAAAGDLSRIWDLCPSETPYARWVNRGKIYTVPFAKAKRMLTRTIKPAKG